MQRRYPPLTPKEVESILRVLGFVHTGNKGDHRVFEYGHRHVEVDQGKAVRRGFATPGMKIIIERTGLGDDPESFYRCTKVTAKKIGKKQLTDSELSALKKRIL